MPRALAIETSGRIGSLAVVEDGVVLADESFAHGLQHAAGIVPMIDRLVRSRAWVPHDLTELYVSAGPGSFTGLRIAVTLAKTLALVTGAKIVSVPTARVLVENVPSDARQVIIVLDAKRDQIFTARFTRTSDTGPWTEAEPPRLDALTNMLARAGRPVYLLGEGIPFHQKFIDASDQNVILTSSDTWRARAQVVATVGHAMARQGNFVDVDRFTPIYIRKPEAEEKWEKAHGVHAS